MSYRRSLLLLQAALGIALTMAPTSPARAAAPPLSWKAIAASSDEHTCALRSNGTVWCWGNNTYGELGNKSVPTGLATGAGGADSNLPVPVQGLPAAATAIAVGGDDVSCAVLSTGAVYCWGYNYYGQLGNASAAQNVNNAPLPVQGLPATATAVAIGAYHACASLSTGAVACWGTNHENYELGNASLAVGAKVLATLVPGVVRAQTVAASGASTCALVKSEFSRSRVSWPVGPQCWGLNFMGEAGQPATANDILPTNDTSVPWDITSISVDGLETCATSPSQGTLCWGDDSVAASGNLGDNFACFNATYTGSGTGFCYLPQQVQFNSTPGSDPTNVAVGAGADCAVYGSGKYGAGSVYCWGWNAQGQVGLPANNPNTEGGLVAIPVWGQATAVATGEYHTCAIVNGGYNIQCWGYNGNGQLGNGSYTSSYLPVTAF